jgi:hypothetical protein
MGLPDVYDINIDKLTLKALNAHFLSTAPANDPPTYLDIMEGLDKVNNFHHWIYPVTNCPKVISALASSPNATHRAYIAQNPHASLEVIKTLIQDHNNSVVVFAVRHPVLPAEYLCKLLQSNSFVIVRNALINKNTPTDEVRKFLNHSDKGLAFEAWCVLKNHTLIT